MKYFVALINIPNPNPPVNPVINLRVLLLSRYPSNCVNPSIADGINSIAAVMSKRML